MARIDEDLDTDERDDAPIDPSVGWGIVTFVFALGVAFIAADLTPGVHGPGLVAFAVGIVIAELGVRALRSRL